MIELETFSRAATSTVSGIDFDWLSVDRLVAKLAMTNSDLPLSGSIKSEVHLLNQWIETVDSVSVGHEAKGGRALYQDDAVGTWQTAPVDENGMDEHFGLSENHLSILGNAVNCVNNHPKACDLLHLIQPSLTGRRIHREECNEIKASVQVECVWGCHCTRHGLGGDANSAGAG